MLLNYNSQPSVVTFFTPTVKACGPCLHFCTKSNSYDPYTESLIVEKVEGKIQACPCHITASHCRAKRRVNTGCSSNTDGM
ncbi:hypothetical protein GDO86_017602 [Hymenochirus boettgeri]|uniref:Uncharacterized protein n=1 Tax=Hymenochirus boettgeri TaxID=247094 RepID=A0A8T2IQM8_9PIPI|nr:hypothetical protein GDO86_017602 [Hymenochirus boettgeri]